MVVVPAPVKDSDEAMEVGVLVPLRRDDVEVEISATALPGILRVTVALRGSFSSLDAVAAAADDAAAADAAALDTLEEDGCCC